MKLFYVFSALFWILTNAHAATTGSITISGTVPAATAITVTTVPGYNSLDLTSSPTDLTVANVQEVNNTANGYKVTLTSANSGFLKNGTVDQLAYTAKYGGSSVTLSSSGSVVTNTGATNNVVSVSKALSITYTGKAASAMMAGTFSDTLTFTIAAN